MIYLDDIEPGTKASFGRYEVTREEVLEFARQYDPQPFHLSDEAAAQTYFGKISASGWHTCAMIMRMLVDNMRSEQGEQRAGLGSPGVDEIRWLKPVYPGDTLRLETEVTEVRPSRSRPEMGSIHSTVTCFNQHDDVVATVRSIGLMRRRPAQD